VSHKGPFDKSAEQVARFLAMPLEADGVKKTGILAHPPGQGRYTFGSYELEIPGEGNPWLAFSTGLAIKPYPGMDGVTFETVLSRNGQERRLWKQHQRTVPWQTHEIPLEDCRGEKVRVEFRTHEGPSGSTTVADWGAWGEPRLLVGPKDASTIAFDFVKSIASADTGVLEPGYQFTYGSEAIERYGGLPLLKGPVVTTPYFVYQLHSLLKKNRLALALDGQDGISKDACAGILPSADESGMAILVWTFDLGTKQSRDFEIGLKSLPRGAQFRLRQYLIDSTHTNPYYDYVIAKKPDNDGRYNLEDGKLAVVRDELISPDAAGHLKLAFSLESKAVSLIELSTVK
jgi:hypothetical protein